MNDLINGIRNKLDMSEPKDVETWDTLMEIQKTPQETLITGMVDDMRAELLELDAQVETMEKFRIKHLFDKNLSQPVENSLKILRKERDELQQTLQSKAYQGLDGRPGSQPLDTRRRT